mmetsp:Transcript_1208/g.3124  ORF Transcript_1208/g.3124 Transcript_1208/m.3124 type:complete len:219 (-) Transcript_1208:74-730(-)
MDCRDLHDKVGDLNLRADSCVTRKQQLLRRGWPARPSPRPARPPRAPRSGAPRAHRRASATSPASRWPQSSPRARRGRRGGRPAARSRIRTLARRSLQHALANRLRRPATMQPSSLPLRQPRAAWRRYLQVGRTAMHGGRCQVRGLHNRCPRSEESARMRPWISAPRGSQLARYLQATTELAPASRTRPKEWCSKSVPQTRRHRLWPRTRTSWTPGRR